MINAVQLGLKGHQGACLNEIARRDDIRLAAIWDDDQAALDRHRGGKFCDANTVVTANLDEVMALDDVQLAMLAEDNGSRAENLIACARRGWHILAEKPLATTLADLDRVRAEVTAAGVRLSMMMTMRFEPIYLAMRQAVAAGAVGKPLQMTAQKSYRRGQRPAWQRNPASFGGSIPFIGIHAVDMLRYVSGCEYTRCAALHHNEGLPGAGAIEESCSILLELAGGGSATVRLDYLRPAKAPTHGDDRFRIAGSDGVIEAMAGRLSLITNEQEEQILPLGEPVSLLGTLVDELNGDGEHLLTAADCYLLTEIVLKARDAADTGQWIAL